MPTSLPRRRRRLDGVLLFMLALGLAFLVIEAADPAVTDVFAALGAAP